MSKRMRLPNGFGRITKLSNRNLRNPWRAMVTVGTDENGKPIGKLLKPQSYFPTYNDAYAALLKYNANPYDVSETFTCTELYEQWSTQYFKQISEKSAKTYELCWKYCSTAYKIILRQLRSKDIKYCIECGTYKDVTEPSPNMKKNIRMLWCMMLDYALEHEMIDRNIAREIKLDRTVQKRINDETEHHVAFTDEEIVDLWKRKDEPFVDLILIQTYSGWRPKELLELETANIIDGVMTGGMKTEAGTSRAVPIHPAIKDLVEKRMVGKKLAGISYSKYYTEFTRILPNHKPHDARKTFVTLAKKYNVDEYAIKRIVGHQISDITEKVYTDRPIEWLKSEMAKIKRPCN